MFDDKLVRRTFFHDPLEDGDVVVEKHRSSAFFGTDLDMILRSNGIETVVFTDGLSRVLQTKKDATVHVDPNVAAADVMIVRQRCEASWPPARLRRAQK